VLRSGVPLVREETAVEDKRSCPRQNKFSHRERIFMGFHASEKQNHTEEISSGALGESKWFLFLSQVLKVEPLPT
jgi:hypothetical protein